MPGGGDSEQIEGGVLYVVGGPIGNLGDVSLRALDVLRAAEVLACEDTRRTRQLLTRYEIPRPRTLLALHEHNEDHAAQKVVGFLADGDRVALVSDAGTPLVSDPGYRTVRLAASEGYEVRAVPGASAVLAALAVSGLPSSSFTFKGFAPRKPGPRRRFLEAEAEQPHTLVVFESPHRIGAFLRDAVEVLGDREACVCLELTKRFESERRGHLSELAEAFADAPPRGEVTVVIAGGNEKFRA